MKNKRRLFSIFFAMAVCLLLTSPVLAQTPTPQPNGPVSQGDKVVVANTYRLQSGETLQGDLAVIGGTATIESGAIVNGDIVLVGGTLTNEGTINGNLVAVGGVASLTDNSSLIGDIVTVGASLKKSPNAYVSGKVTEQTPSINIGNGNSNGNSWQFPWNSSQNLLFKVLTGAFESLALAALAVVIGLILPLPTRHLAEAIRSEPLVAGAVGLLTVIGAPILLIILIITLILIPIAILAVIVLGLAVLFGWIGLGYEIGDRIGNLFHQNWSVPVASGIGVLIISLLVSAFNLLPCVGWIVSFIFALLGLGAIMMTRFGAVSSVTPQPSAKGVPPAMPTPPQPPALQ